MINMGFWTPRKPVKKEEQTPVVPAPTPVSITEIWRKGGIRLAHPRRHALDSTLDHSSSLANAQAPQFLLLDGSRAMTGNLLTNAANSIDIGSLTYPWRYGCFRTLYSIIPTGLAIAYQIVRTNTGVSKIIYSYNQTTNILTIGHVAISGLILSAGNAILYGAPLQLSSIASTAIPEANDANVGMICYVDDGPGAGVDGKLIVCYRKADDSYAWRDLISGVDV